jgi:hypothetical protein
MGDHAAMLVTDDFVFLHVPKTGGTFIQTVLRAHLPVVDHGLDLHASHANLAEPWRDLPGFYVVRNPWDWYVSWYHWTLERGRHRETRGKGTRSGSAKGAVWEGLLRSGEAGFAEAVRRACTIDDEIEHPLAPTMRREGLDLYSACVRDIVGEALDRPDYTALRLERLRKPLVRYLRAHTEVSPEPRQGDHARSAGADERARRGRRPLRRRAAGPGGRADTLAAGALRLLPAAAEGRREAIGGLLIQAGSRSAASSASSRLSHSSLRVGNEGTAW